jgi:hypothetical protein
VLIKNDYLNKFRTRNITILQKWDILHEWDNLSTRFDFRSLTSYSLSVSTITPPNASNALQTCPLPRSRCSDHGTNPSAFWHPGAHCSRCRSQRYPHLRKGMWRRNTANCIKIVRWKMQINRNYSSYVFCIFRAQGDLKLKIINRLALCTASFFFRLRKKSAPSMESKLGIPKTSADGYLSLRHCILLMFEAEPWTSLPLFLKSSAETIPVNS